jgi:hypothetical protein
MVDNTYVCNKCFKSITVANRTLHDVQCKHIQEPDSDNLEYGYCQQCDNYVPATVYEDHKLSHDFQGSDESRGSMDVSSDSNYSNEQYMVPNNNISTSVTTRTNPDGSITTIREERDAYGNTSRIISTSNNRTNSINYNPGSNIRINYGNNIGSTHMFGNNNVHNPFSGNNNPINNM